MSITGVRTLRTGWWPDRATVGLVIAGFFGVSLFTFFMTSGGTLIGNAISGTVSTLRSYNVLPSLPAAERILAGASVVASLCLGIAAIGGVLLVLHRRAGVPLALGGIAAAVVAELVSLVAVGHVSNPGPNAGYYVQDAAVILWHVALAILLLGGLPMPRLTASEPAGPVSVP